MAGEGRQFKEVGYTFPKPLIEIHGKPMIQWVIENMNAEATFIFIVKKNQYKKYHLKYLLNLLAPKCKIIVLDKPTNGAAETVLAAAHLFNDNHPIAVANADQHLIWNSNEFFYAMAADSCDGGIVTFTATHPKWSFVKKGKDGMVKEVAEKIPISDLATAGIYYFKKGKDFIRGAKAMIKKGITTNGQYYVCPVYNELLAQKKKIRAFHIDKMWSFATPEDVDYFIKKYNTETGS